MQIYHTDWQGRMLGRYRLGRLLGRGGMGEVWQAEDTELHRQVAAKLLPSVLAHETGYLRAFEQEARTAASLEHPHILPVHDFGEERADDEVITYLIMPLITGGSLRERMMAAQGIISPDESLHYLRQAAQAIDYAHSRHVLHRDIKPANMLLQQQWLLLADFGISKLLATAATRSQTHAGAGTPDYMAPEQAQGHAEPASDAYSLAVIAYQLLTGQKPLSGNTPYETMMKHLQQTPPSPRQFNPRLSPMVEIVFLRGLAKRPEGRFPSCTAFIDALEASLHPEMLQTTSDDPDATLLAPWSKRAIESQHTQRVTPSTQLPSIQTNPAYVSPSHPASIYQPGPGLQTNQVYSPPPQSGPMNQQAPFATPQPMMYPPANQVSMTSAPTTMSDRPPAPEHKINRRGLLIGSTAAAVALAAGGGALAYYLHNRPTRVGTAKPIPGPHKLIAGIPILRLAGHTDAVWDVIWHPSGRYLATAGADTHVLLWDIGAALQKNTKTMQLSKKPLYNWKFSDNIDSNMLSWSSDGRTLAVLGTQGTQILSGLYMLDATRQSTPVAYIDRNVADPYNQPSYFMLSWSPAANLLAVSVFTSMNAELWQVGKTDGPIKTLKGPPVPANKPGLEIEELAWSHDGTLLAGLGNDSNVVIWDVKTGKILQPALSSPDRPNTKNVEYRRAAITWSPTVRNQVASTDADIAITWDALANKMLDQLGTDDPTAHVTTPLSSGFVAGVQVNGLAWSPNGRYIAGSYEHSRQVYIWDTLNKHPKKTSDGLHVQDLLFGAHNGHGTFLPLKTGELPASADVTIIDMAWSPDGRYLATASNDSTVIIWKVDGA